MEREKLGATIALRNRTCRTRPLVALQPSASIHELAAHAPHTTEPEISRVFARVATILSASTACAQISGGPAFAATVTATTTSKEPPVQFEMMTWRIVT